MSTSTTGKYFVKNTSNGSFSDVASLYSGVRVLSVNGFNSRGKSLNTYVEQWMDGSTDFLITNLDDNNNNPVIVRENVDITVTFIVSQRYSNTTIDVQTQSDSFVDYMTNSDVWVASPYVGKQVHCVALDKVEPKTVKLHRGKDSFIVGEITLHTLEKPTVYPTPTPSPTPSQS